MVADPWRKEGTVSVRGWAQEWVSGFQHSARSRGAKEVALWEEAWIRLSL